MKQGNDHFHKPPGEISPSETETKFPVLNVGVSTRLRVLQAGLML